MTIHSLHRIYGIKMCWQLWWGHRSFIHKTLIKSTGRLKLSNAIVMKQPSPPITVSIGSFCLNCLIIHFHLLVNLFSLHWNYAKVPQTWYFRDFNTISILLSSRRLTDEQKCFFYLSIVKMVTNRQQNGRLVRNSFYPQTSCDSPSIALRSQNDQLQVRFYLLSRQVKPI